MLADVVDGLLADAEQGDLHRRAQALGIAAQPLHLATLAAQAVELAVQCRRQTEVVQQGRAQTADGLACLAHAALRQLQDGRQGGAQLVVELAMLGEALQTLVQPGQGLRQAVVQVIGNPCAFLFLGAHLPVHQLGHGPLAQAERLQQLTVVQVGGEQGGDQLQGFEVFLVRTAHGAGVAQQQGAEYFTRGRMQWQMKRQGNLRQRRFQHLGGVRPGQRGELLLQGGLAEAGAQARAAIGLPEQQHAAIHGAEAAGPLQGQCAAFGGR